MIRFLKFIFSYTYTWLTFGIILIVNILFFIIFSPPTFLSIILIIGSIFFGFFWIIMQINSPDFISQSKNILQRVNVSELKRILKNCDPSFKEKAEEILKLLGKISSEFKEKHSLEELDYLIDNLYSLSQNNRDLYKRLEEFGTKDQKAIMREKINTHIKSLQETYEMLQTFSGNLALLEANFNEVKSVSTKLKYINQTMQDLIKEI